MASATGRADPDGNDTQDSQALLLAVYAEHGVGFSGAALLADQPLEMDSLQQNASPISRPRRVESDLAGADENRYRQIAGASLAHKGSLEAECDEQEIPSTEEPIVLLDLPPAWRRSSQDHVGALAPPRPSDDAVVERAVKGLQKRRRDGRRNKKNKMDGSQSPTQSNHGRSYDQYNSDDGHGLISSPVQKDLIAHDEPTSQLSHAGSSHPPETFDEDDTGAVRFDLIPYKMNPTHATQEPPETLPLPQLTSSFAPETPAVAPRPLANHGQVLAPSQLFAQTQYTSAVKPARTSPTSSRPSPNLFPHNSISPNNFISSPLKDRGLRTSSPELAPTSSMRGEGELLQQGSIDPVTDPVSDPATDPVSPEALSRPTNDRSVPEPIGSYEPSTRADERFRADSASAPHKPLDDEDEDDEEDILVQRRRRARYRQERATRSLNSIMLARSSSDGVHEDRESDATSTAKPKKDDDDNSKPRHNRQLSAEGVAEDLEADIVSDVAVEVPSTAKVIKHEDRGRSSRQGRLAPADEDSQETVADSQIDEASKAEVGPIVERVADSFSGHASAETRDAHPDVLPAEHPDGTDNSKETIPETSPVGARGTPAVTNVRVFSASQPEPRSTRRVSRLRSTSSLRSSSPPHAPSAISSTLSTLSATPGVSSSTTPDTNYADDTNGNVASSPAAARTKRLPKGHSASLKTYSKTRSAPKRASSIRHARQISLSTDEPSHPPSSVSTAETTTSGKNVGRTSRNCVRKSMNLRESSVRSATREPTANSGVFHGMLFAISFQTQSPRDTSEEKVRSLKERIEAAGGEVLSEGFSELFKPNASPDSLELKANAQNRGFTALIADGHSRKVKYMQALALGIPCLAWQWIEACLSRNDLVDWSPYMLCAGSSKVLGEAIRSRILPLYNARTATLEGMVAKRPKMLEDTRILAILGKSKKLDEKMPYLFLMQVLGASVSKASTIKDARIALREAEESEPFDLIYMGEVVVTDVEILFGHAAEATTAKKRKRRSTEEDGPPPKRLNTMTDELLVQSLILGRLVEPEEMDY